MVKCVAVILLGVMLAGCASVGPSQSRTFSSAQVKLEKNNFRVVKANAQGTSSGFFLLGVIPFPCPQRSVAMSRLYKNANVKDAESYTVINVIEEQALKYFLLFSVPTYRVSGDVIEFVDEGGKQHSRKDKNKSADEDEDDDEDEDNSAEGDK